MRWVTRRRRRVNRTATAWLIRHFIDPNAVFLFVAPEEVAEIERTTRAIGFDAPGARYPHLDANGMRSMHRSIELDERRQRRLTRCLVAGPVWPLRARRVRTDWPHATHGRTVEHLHGRLLR